MRGKIKKHISIKFVDFWVGFDPYENFITKILENYYIIDFNESPNYLFYSSFGYDHLNFSGIRVFFTGENHVPDFNICDYAIGYHTLIFDDRFIRYPLYRLYSSFKLAKNKHIQNKLDFSDNKKMYCNYVYSNPNANPIRSDFHKQLSEKYTVHSGGKIANNIGYLVSQKLEFQKKYLFTIAFENDTSVGYTTEKITDAFAARTIPIYWGNPQIKKDFNPKAFINVQDYENTDLVIKDILNISQNKNRIQGYLNAPIFTDEQRSESMLLEKKFELFLKNIFDQDINDAFRRSRFAFAKHYNVKNLNISKLLNFKIIKLFIKLRRLIKKRT